MKSTRLLNYTLESRIAQYELTDAQIQQFHDLLKTYDPEHEIAYIDFTSQAEMIRIIFLNTQRPYKFNVVMVGPIKPKMRLVKALESVYGNSKNVYDLYVNHSQI